MERYVVELSNSFSQPFSAYHKKDCVAIGSYGMVLAENYIIEKAIYQYGAQACPRCFDKDDRVAELS